MIDTNSSSDTVAGGICVVWDHFMSIIVELHVKTISIYTKLWIVPISLCRRKKIIITFFVCISFCTFVLSRVITLKHNNEELRNTNDYYLVTQFPCNPNNRLILR